MKLRENPGGRSNPGWPVITLDCFPRQSGWLAELNPDQVKGAKINLSCIDSLDDWLSRFDKSVTGFDHFAASDEHPVADTGRCEHFGGKFFGHSYAAVASIT